MSLWYLLFDGSSPDGRGEPTYLGRTSHKSVAYTHFKKVTSNPHSTGKVMIANDFTFKEATRKDFASVS